jgi:hypothetical protein
MAIYVPFNNLEGGAYRPRADWIRTSTLGSTQLESEPQTSPLTARMENIKFRIPPAPDSDPSRSKYMNKANNGRAGLAGPDFGHIVMLAQFGEIRVQLLDSLLVCFEKACL